MSTPPFPMFVGCGRSGTTLVRAIFDSHSELAVAHHAQFIVTMGRRRRRYEGPGGLDAGRFCKDLFASPRFAHLQLEPDDVRAALRDGVPDFAEGVRRVLALFASSQGKSRYADKTPGHVVRIPLLAELFPEARFVHIIRDGRNSWVGYRDRGFGPKTVGDAAYNWVGRVGRGRRAGLALEPHRYHEVRYEELLDSPAETLERVCGFLELNFEESMLRYHERAETVLSGLAPADRADFENVFRPLTKGMRDWRTEMSEPEQATFHAIAGDLLAELGYEVPEGHRREHGTADRLAISRRWLGWQSRRAAFRLTLLRRRLGLAAPSPAAPSQPSSRPTRA